MAIVRLALGNPSANTDSLIHTATRQSLVSVIATNTASATATVDVWVAPQGATSASAYAYIAKGTTVPASNSLETFRFALQTNDRLYVRSSTSNISFSVNAIYESSGNYNLVTVSDTAPSVPSLGDVWASPSASAISFWDGSSWISAVVVAGVSSVNGQTGAITNIATTSGKLSQFAATTSSELAGVISDETGSGSLVFAGSPTFTGTVIFPTSASAGASVRIPHGNIPSSPTNGDVWTTSNGLFIRINGATIGPIGEESISPLFLGGM